MYIKTLANTFLVSAAVLSAFTVTGQNALTAPTKQQVEQIVKQYILDHPEVVLESVKSFQQREQTAQRERAKDSIATKEAELLRDAASPATGKAEADITVVEFFDYHCG